jgi:hypothetical protein
VFLRRSGPHCGQLGAHPVDGRDRGGIIGVETRQNPNFQNVIARRYWQLPGGAGSGTGGCGQVPCLTHCTTTKELVPDVPRCVACQYEPSG